MLALILTIATFAMVIYFVIKKPAYAIVFLLFYYSIISTLITEIGINDYRLTIRYFLFFLLLVVHYRANRWRKNINYYLKNRVFRGFIILTGIIFFHSFFIAYESKDIRIEFFYDYILYVFVPFIVTLLVLDTKNKIENIPFAIISIGLYYFIITFIFIDISQIDIADRLSFKEQGINPIALSRIGGIIFIISYFYSTIYKESKKKYFCIFMSIISVFILLLAKQRGTIIGVGLSLIFFILFSNESKNKTKIYWSILLIIIVFAFGIINIQQFGVIERFTELENLKEVRRYKDYGTVWNFFKENIFLGLGPRGYYIETGRHYPHNMLLELIAEYGIIGILIIYLIFFTTIKLGFRVLKNKMLNFNYKIFVALWIVLLISVFVSGNIVYNKLFWVITAILLSVKRLINYEFKKYFFQKS